MSKGPRTRNPAAARAETFRRSAKRTRAAKIKNGLVVLNTFVSKDARDALRDLAQAAGIGQGPMIERLIEAARQPAGGKGKAPK